MYLHKEGIDEPNKEHVWAANAITTLDFKAVKGAIVLLSRWNCRRSLMQKTKLWTVGQGQRVQ